MLESEELYKKTISALKSQLSELQGTNNDLLRHNEDLTEKVRQLRKHYSTVLQNVYLPFFSVATVLLV